MKVAVVGKGGVGKSTLLALIHRVFACEIYDSGPAFDLEELCPQAKRYKSAATVIEPALVEFCYATLRKLKNAPDFKVLIVTTPHVHALTATRKMVNTLNEDFANELLGIVVNQSTGELSEKISARLGVKLVGSLPLVPELDDHLIGDTLATFKIPRELEEAVAEIGRFLRLRKRAGKEKEKEKKKKKSLFSFGG